MLHMAYNKRDEPCMSDKRQGAASRNTAIPGAAGSQMSVLYSGTFVKLNLTFADLRSKSMAANREYQSDRKDLYLYVG